MRMVYDPMIAKLVAFERTRKEAADRLADALDAFYIRGLNHNISSLAAIAIHPRFRAGRLTTGFIAEEFPDGFRGAELTNESRRVLVAAAAVAQRRLAEHELAIGDQLPHHKARPPDRLTVKMNGNGEACE